MQKQIFFFLNLGICFYILEALCLQIKFRNSLIAPSKLLEDSDQYENIGILMTLSMIEKTCDLTEKKAGTA